MTYEEQRIWLIRQLLAENGEYKNHKIPEDPDEQWRMLRGLFNVRPAHPVSKDFLKIQDEFLTQVAKEKGITESEDLRPSQLDSRLYVWQGDITALRVDVTVNAANDQMEGCWRIGHTCVDNHFHSFAGVQMRMECHRQMNELRKKYGMEYVQPTAVPMITSGYNLPAKHVIHVVGPVVYPYLMQKHKNQLAECYWSCLSMAAKNKCKSIAFCCISTGVFMFPQDKAAEIAVQTVHEWLELHPDGCVKKVIFNVFKDKDLQIYNTILNPGIKNYKE